MLNFKKQFDKNLIVVCLHILIMYNKNINLFGGASATPNPAAVTPN